MSFLDGCLLRRGGGGSSPAAKRRRRGAEQPRRASRLATHAHLAHPHPTVDLSAIQPADATIAVQLCFDKLVPALQGAGVSLESLLALQAECGSETPACLRVGGA